MATIDDKLKDQAGQERNLPRPTNVGSLTPTASFNAAQRQGPNASSGKFTNIQNIISANQGAGQRLANVTTGAVDRNVQQAGQQVNQFGQQIGQKIGQEKERIETGKQQISDVIAKAAAPTQVQPADTTSAPAQAPVQNPFAMLDDQNQFNALRQVVTGQSNVADIGQQKQQMFSTASGALTQAQQEARQLANERGRFNLLRKAVGGPMYSSGMAGLDNVLMSTEGGRTLNQALQSNMTNLGARGQELNTQRETLGQQLSQTGQLAADVSRDLSNQLTSGIDDINNKELDTQFENTNQAVTKEADILSRIVSGNANLADPEVQKLIKNNNINLNQTLYGLDIGNFLKGSSAVDRNALITDEQALRLNALKRLSGADDSQLVQAGNKTIEDFRSRFDVEGLEKEAMNRRNKIIQDAMNRTLTARGEDRVYQGDIARMAGNAYRTTHVDRSMNLGQALQGIADKQTTGYRDPAADYLDTRLSPIGLPAGAFNFINDLFGGGRPSAEVAAQRADAQLANQLEAELRRLGFYDTLASRQTRRT